MLDLAAQLGIGPWRHYAQSGGQVGNRPLAVLSSIGQPSSAKALGGAAEVMPLRCIEGHRAWAESKSAGRTPSLDDGPPGFIRRSTFLTAASPAQAEPQQGTHAREGVSVRRGNTQPRLVLRARFKHLGAARAAVAARGSVRVHRGLRNLDHAATVGAGRVQGVDEVGKRG